jgi:sugar-specific transcriptional regulator TrmB
VIKIVRFKYPQPIPLYMTTDQETIKKTKLFGLNTYEAKIWVALLSRNTSTAGELSDIANVPRSRSYDVLESLEKKGFVVMKPGKPIKYLAVPPKEVLERVKNKVEKKTEKHLSAIKSASFTNLINTTQELYEKNTSRTDNIVAVLRGRRNAHKHLGFLFRGAKKDILFSVEQELGEHPKILDELKDKQKTIKLSCKGLRMGVVDDDNTIIFPLSEKEVHPDYDLCIWIRNKYTTRFLKHLLASA